MLYIGGTNNSNLSNINESAKIKSFGSCFAVYILKIYSSQYYYSNFNSA